MSGLKGSMALGMAVCSTLALPVTAEAGGGSSPLYNFVVDDIDGKPRNLSEYRGKLVLIVNVASKCGFTYQYEGLEKLYQTYKDRGLVILGFPSNDFLGQEPGSEEQIKNFCTLTYGVSFPMFAKIRVKGAKADPLYKYLTSKVSNGAFGGAITWNFNKFLIGRDGRTLARFGSKDEPTGKDMVAAIEKALGE